MVGVRTGGCDPRRWAVVVAAERGNPNRADRDAAAAATRPPGDQVRRRWVRRTRRTSAGSNVSGTGWGLVEVDDLDRHPAEQAGEARELADRAGALLAPGEVPLERDALRGGQRTQHVGAVVVRRTDSSCAHPHLLERQPQRTQRVVGARLHGALGTPSRREASATDRPR